MIINDYALKSRLPRVRARAQRAGSDPTMRLRSFARFRVQNYEDIFNDAAAVFSSYRISLTFRFSIFRRDFCASTFYALRYAIYRATPRKWNEIKKETRGSEKCIY